MADEFIALPNRTRPAMVEVSHVSRAEVTALPTSQAASALPHVEQSSRAYGARNAELEAELLAARRQDARLGLIVDSAIYYAIFTTDATGRLTSWNAGAQAIFGYTQAEILGRSAEIVFTAEDRTIGGFATEMRRAGTSATTATVSGPVG